MTLAAALKKLSVLLRHDDPAHVDQGVALALALDDPRVIDALLQGTELTDHPATEHEPGEQQIIPGPRITPLSAQNYSQMILPLLRLVTQSEHPAARALRERIHDLLWDLRACPLDLSKLPALRQLALTCSGTDDITSLAALPALEALDLHGAFSSLEFLRSESVTRLSVARLAGPLFAPEALPRLTDLKLSIHAAHPDLSALCAMRSLRSLSLVDSFTVRAFDGIESLTDLTALSVTGASITSLEPLRALRSLCALHLESTPVEDLSPLAGLSNLESLQLQFLLVRSFAGLEALTLTRFACANLSALETLAHMPTCAPTDGSLSLLHLPKLRSLDGIQRSLGALTALSLVNLYALTSLDALRGAPRLERLRADQCSTLRALDGLEDCASLTSLSLSRAHALQDLSALRSLPRLRRVLLHSARALTDIRALATLPALEVLDLRACAGVTDLTPLAHHPRLTLIALHESSVREADVPASLRATCSWDAQIPSSRMV